MTCCRWLCVAWWLLKAWKRRIIGGVASPSRYPCRVGLWCKQTSSLRLRTSQRHPKTQAIVIHQPDPQDKHRQTQQTSGEVGVGDGDFPRRHHPWSIQNRRAACDVLNPEELPRFSNTTRSPQSPKTETESARVKGSHQTITIANHPPHPRQPWPTRA